MNNLFLTLTLLGKLTVTSYQSTPSATDSTPYQTSTGERVSIYGVAISRDLLCPACRKLHHRCKCPDNPTKLHYGDLLLIDGIGKRFVNDVMGPFKHYRAKVNGHSVVLFKKQKGWCDIWVPSYKAEHEFHKKHGVNKHLVWVMREKIKPIE